MNADTLSPTSRTAPRCVLVLGANGRFGAAAALAFQRAGWRVLAQVRRAPAQPVAGIETVAIALHDTDALARRAAGASVVVYAVNPLYTRWEAELMPLFESGLAVARSLGAHFMLPGNVYNFGADMPTVLREDTPQRPTTRKGEQRVEMERRLARHSAETGLAATVIRAGDFFGAGSGSWFDQAIVKSLSSGKLVYPGPVDLTHAWAYLPDLANAFVAVAERGATGYGNLHFAGHTLTGAQLLDGIAEAAGMLGLAPARGFRRGGMPWGLIAAIGWVRPLWRELVRMSYLWRVAHGLEGRQLAALPGVTHTPFVAAARDSLLALGFTPRATLQPAR